jgi:hypothetical protein
MAIRSRSDVIWIAPHVLGTDIETIIRKDAARKGYDVMPRKSYAWETGADGKPQAVIPGAEQISLARLKARQPLRPTKAQKPCDIGLFSDEADQLDIVDMFMDSTEEE